MRLRCRWGRELSYTLWPVLSVCVFVAGFTITKTCLFKYTENFTTKKWKCWDKKFWCFFIYLLKTIDCGYSLEPPRRGGSNEYLQSMVLSRNKKNNVYPSKPQFYCIKVGLKLYRYVFVMRSLIRIFTGRILDSLGYNVSSCWQTRPRSDFTDAQADLSLNGAQLS